MTNKIINVAGAISGTSMDGIDICVIRTDGERIFDRFAGATYPYSDDLKIQLQSLITQPDVIMNSTLKDIERMVSEEFAAAINTHTENHAIDLIGCHGQTVLHRPDIGYTRQLGDGALLAQLCQCDCVSQFRLADMKNGGEGAPLAPLYHHAIMADLAPVMVLNLGGVANVTFLGGGHIIAGDTGPANAILDDYVQAATNKPFDIDGNFARQGTCDMTIVDAYLKDEYFARPLPKSLDRNHFHELLNLVAHLDMHDACATILACSIVAIKTAMAHAPAIMNACYVCGGGAANSHFVEQLQIALEIPCIPIDQLGYNSDDLEAQAFAFLAVRACHGLPLSLPTTTGVDHPCSGGEIHRYERVI